MLQVAVYHAIHNKEKKVWYIGSFGHCTLLELRGYMQE